jgi:hypothetical protein
VVGSLKQLDNEEFNYLFWAPGIIKWMNSKIDTMGGTCSVSGRNEMCIHNFCRKKTEGQKALEGFDVGCRIISK